MAEDQAKAGGGAPAAVERSRLVTLPICGKTVEVRRWSYTRLMQVSRFLTESYESIDEENTPAALAAFYSSGHTRFLEVAKLSLAPEHRAVIDDEADASDVFAVMEAAFQINSGDNLKKAAGLAGTFLLGRITGIPQKEGEKTTPPVETKKAESKKS